MPDAAAQPLGREEQQLQRACRQPAALLYAGPEVLAQAVQRAGRARPQPVQAVSPLRAVLPQASVALAGQPDA